MANQYDANGARQREKTRSGRMNSEFNGQNEQEDEDEDDEDNYEPVDRIRRSYHLTSQHPSSSQQAKQQQQQRQQSNNTARLANAAAPPHQGYHMPPAETIQVTLNESYFARERRFIVSQLANARQKLNSLQLFNPAQNENLKQQQQQEWSEKVSASRRGARGSEIESSGALHWLALSRSPSLAV